MWDITKEKQRKHMIIDVVIPVYYPDNKLEKTIKRLQEQSYPVHRIYVIHTCDGTETLAEKKFLQFDNVEYGHISRMEFDHGGTRNRAFHKSDAEILVCLVQDAVVTDSRLIEKLAEPFADERVAAVYGRHMTDEHCSQIEQFARGFNYPPPKQIKTIVDEKALGIKTYFTSNVCCAYRRLWYEKAGGFENHIIASEDMILAWKMMKLGAAVVYQPEARVLHYHSYGMREQFQRNFDIGVSQAQHPELFQKVSAKEEGMALVRKTAKYLMQEKKYVMLPSLLCISMAKYIGFWLGIRYRSLPKKMVLKCTRNLWYWRRETKDEE